MQVDRNLNCVFQSTYKLCSLIRKKKSCHILDTDRICAHFLDLFCNVCPVFQSISIAKSIGKSNLSMSFFFVCSLNCGFQVTHVVEAVKNTDDINSVCCRFLYKILYHVICIRTVSEDILSAEQHLKLCVFEAVTEFTESFPWIFLQETKRSIKSSATPALYCMVAYFVHFINDRKHLLCAESCCDQRLMRITQNSFHDFNRFFF